MGALSRARKGGQLKEQMKEQEQEKTSEREGGCTGGWREGEKVPARSDLSSRNSFESLFFSLICGMCGVCVRSHAHVFVRVREFVRVRVFVCM